MTYDYEMKDEPEAPIWLKTAAKSMWDSYKTPNNGASFFLGLNEQFLSLVFGDALAGKIGPILTYSIYGFLLVEPPQIVKALLAVLGQEKPLWVVSNRQGVHTIWLSNDDTLVILGIGQDLSVDFGTLSGETNKKLQDLLEKVVYQETAADTEKGRVYTLVNGMGGMSMRYIGIAGQPIERQNYTDEVLATYDKIKADLSTDSPSGRLAIVSGDPGSGKTYLIKSLLGSVPKAIFVLVSPQLLPNLGGPDFMPALLSVKEGHEGPIVLILEDADVALTRRNSDNMNSVSALLNMGDGILGSTLDIRIVATTNATTLEMDPATRRPGRLSGHLIVNALSPEKASQVYKRLTGKDLVYKEPKTLAEIYQAARLAGWQPPARVDPKPKKRPELL